MEYAAAVDSRSEEAVLTVEASSTAWLLEQRKFREVVRSVQALGETVELQAYSLSNISEVLYGIVEAPLRRAGRPSDAPSAEGDAMTRFSAAAGEMSREV